MKNLKHLFPNVLFYTKEKKCSKSIIFDAAKKTLANFFSH